MPAGEIGTLKQLFLRQAAIPIRTRSLWYTGEDLNLRVPLGGRSISDQAHAPVQGRCRPIQNLGYSRTGAETAPRAGAPFHGRPVMVYTSPKADR